MNKYEAAIKSISRLVIELDDDMISIDWPIVTGKDIDEPDVKKWLGLVNEKNAKIRSNCMSRRICEEFAEIKKSGRTFCLNCDFFSNGNGISQKAQKLLNKIINQAGGRKEAVSKSSFITFINFDGDPKLLLAFGDGLDNKDSEKSSAKPFWLSNEEDVDKIGNDFRKKKNWPRIPLLEFRFQSRPPQSVGRIPIDKARKKATKLALKLNEPVEIWKNVSSKGEVSRVDKILPEKEPARKTKTRHPRKKINSPASVPAKRKELLSQRFEEVLNTLPVFSINDGKKSDWLIIREPEGIDGGIVFVSFLKVGKDVIPRGILTPEELKILLKEEGTKPIPGELLVRKLSLSEICSMVNRLWRMTIQASAPP